MQRQVLVIHSAHSLLLDHHHRFITPHHAMNVTAKPSVRRAESEPARAAHVFAGDLTSDPNLDHVGGVASDFASTSQVRLNDLLPLHQAHSDPSQTTFTSPCFITFQGQNDGYPSERRVLSPRVDTRHGSAGQSGEPASLRPAKATERWPEKLRSGPCNNNGMASCAETMVSGSHHAFRTPSSDRLTLRRAHSAGSIDERPRKRRHANNDSNSENFSSHPTRHVDGGEVASTTVTSHLDPSAVAVATTDRPHTSYQRTLRERKAAQLAPYTTEMERYQRRLIRNDWQDALVTSRESLRAARARRAALDGAPSETNVVSAPSNELEDPKVREVSQEGRNTSRPREKTLRRRRAISPIEKSNAQSIGTSQSKNDEAETVSKVHPGFSNRDLPSDDDRKSLTGELRGVRRRFRVVSDSESDSSLSGVSTPQNLYPSRREATLVSIKSSAKGSDDFEAFSHEGHEAVSSALTHSHNPASSDYVNASEQRNYDQLFRVLKRTMPVRMARSYIDDLKAMDREVQGCGTADDDDRQVSIASEHQAETDAHLIRPGQARRIVSRLTGYRDERFDLVGDPEVDSETKASLSDASGSASTTLTDSVTDSESAQSKEDVGGTSNWGRYDRKRRIRAPRASGSRAGMEEDDIDSLLTRGGACALGRKFKWTLPTGRSRAALASHGQGNDGPSSAIIHGKARIPKSKAAKPTRSRRSGPSQRWESQNSSVSYLRSPRLYESHRRHAVFRLTDEELFAEESSLLGSVQVIHADESKKQPSQEVRTELRPIASLQPGSRAHDGRRALADKGAPEDHGQSKSPRIFHQLKVYTPKRLLCGLDGMSAESLEVDRISSIDRDQVRNQAHPLRPQQAICDDLKDQRREAQAWASLGPMRVDFDIKPPQIGIQCDPEGFIGKGRLFALLQGLPHASSCEEREVEAKVPAANSCAFEPSSEWERIYPYNGFDDSQYSAYHVEMEERLARSERRIEELRRRIFVHLRKPRPSSGEVNSIITCLKGLIALAQARLKGEMRTVRFGLICRLQWLRVHAIWFTRTDASAGRRGGQASQPRDATESTVEWTSSFAQACQDLMATLLGHGLHRTMSSLKTLKHTAGVHGSLPNLVTISDNTVEYWVELIHLCSKTDHAIPDKPMFWAIFEDALQRYQEVLSKKKSPLVVAENMWYSIFAICSLARFSATTGTSGFHSALPSPCWHLVARAISLVRLRYDQHVEHSVPQMSMQSRDSYIRILMQRVLLLMHDWHWQPDGLEPVLTRLFGFFDSHGLQDLPSERFYDFPPFLRLFDVQLLSHGRASHDETAFHLFLRVLATAVEHISARAGPEETGRERAASRILSRFSPVRTMDYTGSKTPTSLERTALLNHYSIALLYLYLVPSSDQQRHLQIQQYLHIGKADSDSQVIGVRAMMYAMLILRHHKRPIDTALGWFKGVFSNLIEGLELHPSQSSTDHSERLRLEKRSREQIRLLLAMLRAIQYVMRSGSLDKGSTVSVYPEASLLDPAWTTSVLRPHLAVRIPSLAVEAMRLLQCFLLARDDHMGRTSTSMNQHTEPPTSLIGETRNESQESCADLFADYDFEEDALLLSAAGYECASGERGKVLASDDRYQLVGLQEAAVAQVLHTKLSPAIFQLLIHLSQPEYAVKFNLGTQVASASRRNTPHDQGAIPYAWEGHPVPMDLRAKFEVLVIDSACSALGNLLVECWARCAWILVQDSHLRSWDFYLRHGNEDLRHLLDDEARRTVMLRFTEHVLSYGTPASRLPSKAFPSSSWFEEDVYGKNLLEVWTCLFTNLVTETVPKQLASLLRLIRDKEVCRVSQMHDQRLVSLFAHITDQQMDMPDMSSVSVRHALLKSMLKILSDVVQGDRRCCSAAIGAVSGMLSAVRQEIDRCSFSSSTAVDTHHDDQVAAAATSAKGPGRARTPYGSRSLDCVENISDRNTIITRAREIVEICRRCFDDRLRRGLSVSLRKTDDLLSQP